MVSRRIGIKDGRKPGWYWADNEIIDVHGAEMKPGGLAVYHAMCRHANEQGECFPSHGLLARETGMSVTTVKKYIKLLCKLELIRKEVRRYAKAGPRSNIYTLLEIPDLGQNPPEAQAESAYALRRNPAAKNTNRKKGNRRTYSTTGASRSHESTDSQEENDSTSDREKVLRDFGLRGSIVVEIAKNRNMAWIRKAMKEMDKPEPGGVIFLHRQGWEPRDEDVASGIPTFCPKCAGLGDDGCRCPDPKPERVLLGRLTPIQQRRWEGVPLEIS